MHFVVRLYHGPRVIHMDRTTASDDDAAVNIDPTMLGQLAYLHGRSSYQIPIRFTEENIYPTLASIETTYLKLSPGLSWPIIPR